ncbi:FliO/MopB family protein [Paeniglutamicibacter sp. R2-26]|uniref:FliO/MopB family protein n=1 Tax=Paeniglutamicibacter sp. R2-26 TaxID=3144417 RepID=UPI003EE74236
MENFFLLLRVLVSLAAVLGLLFYLRKRLLPRFGSPRTSQVTIVERHGIGPKSSVVLLDMHGRRYLLGVGEASINVLDSFEAPAGSAGGAGFGGTEADALPADIADATDDATTGDDAAARRSETFARSLDNASGAPSGTPSGTPSGGAADAAPGPLAGSVLSAETWRQAWAAVKSGRSA